jgi:hypothetical protein
MKRIIRLTESDLTKIIKTIINEQKNKTYKSDDGVEYSYEIIGEYEKEGKKYDLVRYYFTIEDNTNFESETDDVETTKVQKIINKLELVDAIPFKEIKSLGYVKVSPKENIPHRFRRDEQKKTYTYYYSGSEKDWAGNNKQIKVEQVQFDTTYLVPKGYHFNVGYLDHM